MGTRVKEATAPPISVVKSVEKKEAANCLIDVKAFKALRTQETDQFDVKFKKLDNLDAYVFDNVLSKSECKYLVERTEEMGYSFWNESTDTTVFRNADTIEVRQKELAELIWARMETFFNDNLDVQEGQQRWQVDLEGIWNPVGTNNRLLFARYKEGGHFAPHTDGFDIVDFDHRSMYSIVLFLNSCPEGGGTRFYKDEQRDKLVMDSLGRYTGQQELVETTVESVAGRMVVFYHNIMHEGVAVKKGSKYIIRSDVMYKREHPVCATENDKKAFLLYQEAEKLSNDNQVEEAMLMFRKAFKMSPTLSNVYGC